MSFSRNGVRIWNSYLMNFVKCLKRNLIKRNIHNLFLQELTEENEYIIYRICLSMPLKLNIFYLHYPFSFSRKFVSFSYEFCFLFLFPNVNIQLLFFCFPFFVYFVVFFMVSLPDSYFILRSVSCF